MCAACGLPTSHATTFQALALASLISFTLTTFVSASLYLAWRSFQKKWLA